ncbi:MAG: hypothetical protein WCV62_06845 [Candidatus Peribacteraceae bacterium]
MKLCLPHDQERFTEEERNIIAACKTPQETQDFINTIAYNFESDGVARLRSFRRVVRDRVAHCFEGALAAAAILAHHGYPPLLACMEADEDFDHLLFLFRERGKWGSIAQSQQPNLKGRPPIFKNVRDLILSYGDNYTPSLHRHQLQTLRGYCTFDLRQLHVDWMTTEKDVWPAEDLTFEKNFTALKAKNGFREFRCNRDGTITWLHPEEEHDALSAPQNGTEPLDRADD